MSDFTFNLLNPLDFDELLEWHKDPELRSRYGSEEAPKDIYKLMKDDANRFCWVVSKESKRVGYIDFEVNPAEQIGHIGLVVNPELRNKGYGKALLQAFLDLSEVKKLKELRGGIEEENVASIRCFRSVGFKQLNKKPDHEGCFNFSYTQN